LQKRPLILKEGQRDEAKAMANQQNSHPENRSRTTMGQSIPTINQMGKREKGTGASAK
jgi:hypothetical protein